MIIQNCCEVDLCWKKPILNIQLKWIEPIYTDIEQSFSTESWSFGGRELDRLLLMEGEEREGGGGKNRGFKAGRAADAAVFCSGRRRVGHLTTRQGFPTLISVSRIVI